MYSLRRNLVTDATYEPDAGDAMLDAVTAYMDYPWDDARFQQAYGLWGAKTQGEPYHPSAGPLFPLPLMYARVQAALPG
jgi:hypothetical protein